MTRTPPKLTAAIVAAAGLLAVLAPGAVASTATISNANRVNVNAPGNEKNQIRVSYDPGLDVYTVSDPAGIGGNGPCVDVNATRVNCPAAGVASVTVNAGAANDSIALERIGWPATIEGDLDGGTGDDRVSGAGAADSVGGGSGRDILDGGTGPDDLRGSSGTDVIYYGDRTTALIVTVGANNDNDGNELDQTGNDRDTVRGDVETVIAGTAADIVIGDGSDETLYGGEGDDALFGGRGKDLLLGVGGNDFLSGDNGNDVLRGSLGSDRLLGGPESDQLGAGPGNDLLRGGDGTDGMKGKGGIDVIQAKDGFRDRKINCGPGNNRLEVAKRDRRLDPRVKSC